MAIKVNNPLNGLSVTDDGTDYLITYSGTTLFKIRKSDLQLLLHKSVDSDAF